MDRKVWVVIQVRLDLWVLFWVGAVLVTVREGAWCHGGIFGCCFGWVLFRVPQLTTRKGGNTNRFGGCKSGTQSNAAVG